MIDGARVVAASCLPSTMAAAGPRRGPYGKRHITAAIGELAGAMHDDLIDAANWAVEQGIAAPSRIGIYGGSYGGYATLVGVTFTPDHFAAAVDYVGISSLMEFMSALSEWVRPMLRANKDFDLLIVPNADHAMLVNQEYWLRRRWDYFVEHLMGETPPDYRIADIPLDPDTLATIEN